MGTGTHCGAGYLCKGSTPFLKTFAPFKLTFHYTIKFAIPILFQCLLHLFTVCFTVKFSLSRPCSPLQKLMRVQYSYSNPFELV